ncbi:MAG TPA: universal stress protein, partial [Ramlibacter sp.]|nr:universal stress protein [Ramlibacter sp.]
MQLLLPFDGSEAALQACRLVAGYRGDASRLRPTLLNVHRAPVQLWPEAGLNVAVLEEALQKEGHATLAAAREVLAQAGLQADTIVRIAPPAEGILDVAREQDAGAIVMGTRGHGLLAGYAVGSVALRVAPAAPCPVVLTKPGGTLPAEWGRRLRVLAPLDGSEAATQAVRRLVEWRELLGEMHVDLAHFAPALPYLAQVMPPHDDAVRSWSGREAEAAVE